MDYTKIIKEIGRGKNHARDLDRETAFQLYQKMLADEVGELALGGILIAMRIKGEAEEEMLGFYQAMQQQVMRLQAPQGRPMPVVLPSYNGARKQANLTPLLALLLARVGLPVVVHGVLDDSTRVTSAETFRALGLPWSQDAAHAQQRLDNGETVFIPVNALSAPLDRQLGLRWRMGVRNSAHTLAKLATPFAEQDVLRIASVSHPEYVGRVASFFRQIGARGLLMHGTEGEAYANPQRCPQIHYIVDGEQQVLLERPAQDETPELPAAKDAETTARWTERCLAGEVAIPLAIQRQIACCLLAAGEVDSLEQGLARLRSA
ncbi:DNA-binding protein YbiB [Serratia plymuthica]|uniref:DNA-binding protein YbiB n=1 Tax=Serratia plymuthica TaxID=82996 RepID=A0A7T2WC93_SERPL|nr:DNA-binding protein YbiB [Serratia plymuthica]QPS21732.1 DNA-binding protein YbiB [Serratia plymuthica]QPS63343.1 DNA-binding protein YbiB [Serratia plymuthica]RKS64302.1 anthranilate phosphoribosyltransferase [Serratia plymuthica]UNK26770.1 DNA-binding protein YbiB [Serratia plymuthica]CAI2444008.1 Anthranilate phosphoribosyltransferase 2 [Serratia plymuthica]